MLWRQGFAQGMTDTDFARAHDEMFGEKPAAAVTPPIPASADRAMPEMPDEAMARAARAQLHGTLNRIEEGLGRFPQGLTGETVLPAEGAAAEGNVSAPADEMLKALTESGVQIHPDDAAEIAQASADTEHAQKLGQAYAEAGACMSGS